MSGIICAGIVFCCVLCLIAAILIACYKYRQGTKKKNNDEIVSIKRTKINGNVSYQVK